jgi:hypothetical protein
MRILLRSNFDIAGMIGNESVELKEGSSVRRLLEFVAKRCSLRLIDARNGQINGSDFRVNLNGKEHPFWPEGLDTRLRDSDEVQILVMPLAGG